MYYRYDVKKTEDSEWTGVFSAFDPDQRRFWGRILTNPKWYSKNKGVNSKCWFTEKGYAKHHELMEKMIKNVQEKHPNYEFRLITKEKLNNIVMHGKIQCIEI